MSGRLIHDAEGLRLWLEGHGLPLRLTEAGLAARYGRSGEEARVPLDRPLFGIVPALAFRWFEPALCPAGWTADLRPTGDARSNLAQVTAAIAAVLGQGRDVSVSNTIAREWRFGRAVISATVWPPEWNPGPNSRHAADPGAATECRLAIAPGWQPPLSAGQIDQLRAMRPLGWAPVIDAWHAPFLSDWPCGVGRMRPAIGPAPDGALVIAARPALCVVLPPDRLCAIAHHRATPARGGGWQTVSVELAGPGWRGLTVLRGDAHSPLAGARAQALAKALRLPLRRSEAPDE